MCVCVCVLDTYLCVCAHAYINVYIVSGMYVCMCALELHVAAQMYVCAYDVYIMYIVHPTCMYMYVHVCACV